MLLADKELERERLSLKFVAMKMGSVTTEFQDLETHLNRTMDLTGRRFKRSKTASSGRRSESEFNLGFLEE